MFLSDLDLIVIPGRPNLWRYATPLRWSSGGIDHEVPAGFLTDLASIPAALDWLPDLSPDGLSRRPAALHDWLYGGDRTRGKDYADSTLRAALKLEGMGSVGAFEYWYAVHKFGRSSWDGDNLVLRQEHFYTAADFRAYSAGLVGSL